MRLRLFRHAAIFIFLFRHHRTAERYSAYSKAYRQSDGAFKEAGSRCSKSRVFVTRFIYEPGVSINRYLYYMFYLALFAFFVCTNGAPPRSPQSSGQLDLVTVNASTPPLANGGDRLLSPP